MFTVGYGDIAPRDTFERICCIIAIIIGCMFYSFIIGNVTFAMTIVTLLIISVAKYPQLCKFGPSPPPPPSGGSGTPPAPSSPPSCAQLSDFPGSEVFSDIQWYARRDSKPP